MGLVPPTAAPNSNVVLVGVALFFVMHFLAPPDFHVHARANVYVRPCIYLSVCVWCVGGGGGGGGGGGVGCILHICACVCESTLSCNGESELR